METVDRKVILQLIWMDVLRATASMAIILHHWLLLMPYRRNSPVVDALVSFSGDFVYLFFIISGLGLTLAHWGRPSLSWKQWALHRFHKVIFPFWIIVFCTFLLAQVMRMAGVEIPGKPYSVLTLFTYLSFTRNFFPDALTLNGTLWFMPVLVGLYALFPGLMWITRKWGILVCLITACLVGYSAKLLCGFLDYPTDYQRALPFFYLPEFTLGILLGYILARRPVWMKAFYAPSMVLGMGVYFLALRLPALMDGAWLFDETLRAIGIWLIAWPVCAWAAGTSHHRRTATLRKWGKISFAAYLIHCPLIIYLLKPGVFAFGFTAADPGLMVTLGFIYLWMVYLLSRSISHRIDGLVKRIRTMGMARALAWRQGY